MKIHVKTLGCRANRYESERLMRKLAENGHVLVFNPESADLVIVNTCTVTHTADRKSRQEFYPYLGKKKVVVFGCGPRINKGVFRAIKGLDFVACEPEEILAFIGKSRESEKNEFCGAKRLDNIAQRSTNASHALSEDVFVTRANLKIQDGCENYCTYCIVPFSRGKCVSKPLNDVLKEAREFSSNGAKEIVLTGINIGLWKDSDLDFWDLIGILLEKINARIRISSIEPFIFTDKVRKILTHPKFCKHLHVCLQSGSDEVLKNMNRHYSTSDFRKLVASIREAAPDIAITTDLIVGFPGETEENHSDTLEFISEIDFAKIHVFKFSKRKGTAAYFFKPQIPYQTKVRRAKEVASIGEKSCLAYRKRFIGQDREVIFERQKNGVWKGLTDNYLKVEVKTDENLRNALRKYRIES